MNIKSIATNLNKTETEIKDTCKVIFGRVPTQLNNEVQDKLKQHFEFKQLPSGKESLQNTPKTQQSIPLQSNQIDNDIRRRLIEIAKLDGTYQANLYNEVKRDAFQKQINNDDVNLVNELSANKLNQVAINGMLKGKSEKINNIEQVEIVDVTPGKDFVDGEEWKAFLSPGEDFVDGEEWKAFL